MSSNWRYHLYFCRGYPLVPSIAMKLQRTTLILVGTALVLGGFVYFHEIQASPKQDAAQAKTEPLFGFKEEDVQSFNLTTQTQTLSFAKKPAGQVTSGQKAQATPVQPNALVWTLTAPDSTLANDASVAYLLNLLATSKRQQTLTIPVAKQAEFGLDKPLAIVEVKLNNQQSHRLVLGKPNFDRSALYALVDPPANPTGDLSVVLVSIDFQNAVTRPLKEWKAKEPKPETKPEAKSEVKPESQAEPVSPPETKSEAKPEMKPGTQPEAKSDALPDNKKSPGKSEQPSPSPAK